MLLREFPNLRWLKQRIQQAEPWPHCVLNIHTTRAWRPGVKGPVSLFVNLRGFSHCTVEHRRTCLDQQRYFLTRAGDLYDLEIDNAQGTETLNIHFAEGFPEAVYQAWTDRAVDRPLLLFNQSFARTPAFDQLLQYFYTDLHQGYLRHSEEEWLTRIMLHLLDCHESAFQRYCQLARKSSTSETLFRQLSWSIDYMHTYYHRSLSLDDLAAVACMSKYHYLRYFKRYTHKTPYQYLRHLRIEKACEHLRKSHLPLEHLAHLTGFESLSVFSRSFRQLKGQSPSHYRSSLKGNQKLCP